MLDFGAILPEFPYLLAGIPITIEIAVAAFILGTGAALPMAIIRLARVVLVNPLVVAWIEFFRTTPPLLHIVWVYYVLPQVFGIVLADTTVVILALGAHTSAQMAEIFRAGIQSIPRGQGEAATVLGLGAWQRLWYVILPQTIRLVLAPSCNVAVSLIKDTSLAAIIAVPELMNRGQIVSTTTFRPLEVLTLVAVIYFVLTYPVAIAAGYLERRSRVGFRTL